LLNAEKRLEKKDITKQPSELHPPTSNQAITPLSANEQGQMVRGKNGLTFVNYLYLLTILLF
jgi:hypothetical protein